MQLSLDPRQARVMLLAAQGLLAPPKRATKADVLATIGRMQLLQIDTIHVVARSPYLVLHSRLGGYDVSWLDALLAEGAIFECWAHEACFAPIAHLGLHHPDSLHRASHWATKRGARTRREEGEALDGLLAHIREVGPVRTRDFIAPKREGSGGWWGWKNEKRWLEALFAAGDLMVTRRESFHRVYDLRERVLAKVGMETAPMPMPDEARRAMIEAAVLALGVTQARWIADYFRLGKRIQPAELAPLVTDGTLFTVEVEGWPTPGYVHRDHRTTLERVCARTLLAKRTVLLSPFDPVVWDRERARAMFGFDYQLECYTPAPKRTYGYFTLPILHKDRLIGRLDAKAHRAEGLFEVKAIHFEASVAPSAPIARSVARALEASAEWHGTPRVVLGKCKPVAWKPLLKAALA